MKDRRATLISTLAVACLALIAVAAHDAQERSALDDRIDALESRIASLSVDGVKIGEFSARHPDEQFGAQIQVDPGLVWLRLNVGKVAISQGVGISPVVTWIAEGKVQSSIEVNTDTGEWKLVRTRFGPNLETLKEETIELLKPLAP